MSVKFTAIAVMCGLLVIFAPPSFNPEWKMTMKKDSAGKGTSPPPQAPQASMPAASNPPGATAPSSTTVAQSAEAKSASRAMASFTKVLKNVPLNQLVLRPEKFSHRANEAFALEALRPLIESIREMGIKHPPEVYFDEDENAYVAVTGHRRINSLYRLVEDQVIGFTADMLVAVMVLENTTYIDRLAWSVTDNETRLNLSPLERIGVARRFLMAGMPDSQGCIALGISPKQYKRDLTLARNEWMVEHIKEEAVPATYAVELLDACLTHNRFMELKTYLSDWVLEQKIDIAAADMLTTLRPSEKFVKSRLSKELKAHWVKLLEGGKELDARVPTRTARMGFDRKTHSVEIEPIQENLLTMSLPKAAEMFARLQAVLNMAGDFLKRRAAVEEDDGTHELIRMVEDPSRYSFDFIKSFNLEKFIELPSHEDDQTSKAGDQSAIDSDDTAEANVTDGADAE